MRKITAFLIVVCMLVAFGGVSVSASKNTTYTYTVSTDDKWIQTQDAYLPGNIYLKNAGLQSPEDIFIKNGCIYVADTGNSRVLIYNIKSGEKRILGEGTLSSPCGLFVTDDLKVYVADKGAKAVFIFDNAGELKKTIGRPDNYLFSDLSEYTPKNVVVTGEGNIYVCGESAYEGLMQFSPEGEFEGYFAANQKHLTFKETLEDMLLSEKMKQNSLMRRPRTIFNLDINNRNLIYTVTQTNEYDTETQTHSAKEENCIKQFNLAGVNILSANDFMDDAWNFVDVASGDYGNVYAVTYTGLIYEYDSEGNVIFSFGGRAVSSDRNGLFTYATAIDTDENGFVYVLDREKGFVEVFYPTDFAIMTHQAIYDLENGDYEAAEASWGTVLKLNGMARNAHIGYGKTLLHQGNYSEAMQQFRLAGDREYYSEAFWQQRDDWLNEHMIYILVLIIALVVYVIVSSLIKRKKPPKETSYLKKIPTAPMARFGHDLGYIGYMLKHPIDGYYYLKRGEAGSLLSAGILYFVIFAVYIADSMLRGFIFGFSSVDEVPLAFMTAVFFVLCILFVVGNYLVASINSGEGSFRNILVMLPYSLSPYLVITPFIVLATHFLTQNEAFIINFAWLIALVWSGVLIFIGLRETHRYTGRETVKNLLLTLFFMLIAIILMAVLYLLWQQVYAFLRDLVMEVIYRVQQNSV